MSSEARPPLLPTSISDCWVTVNLRRSQAKYEVLCWRSIGLVLGLGGLFLALGSIFTPAISAQSPITWTEPLVLSETEADRSRPAIIADPWGGVHVIWSDRYGDEQPGSGQDAGSGDTLYHAWWDGQSWSEPLDILLVEGEDGLNDPYATVDAEGQIYLIWSGWMGLYFSRAPALGAHNAANWQPAQPIVEGLGVAQSCLVVASGGQLHVVYANLQADLRGNVVYIASTDQGVTWSLPRAISEVYPHEARASGVPQMVLDDRGWLHVVWVEKSPPNWIGHRILYARSEDEGETWTSPEPLAECQPDEQWAEHPSLAATGDGDLHLVWVCGAVERCYRASGDGGRTWSPEEHILVGLLGSSGGDAMVSDHEGTLHLIAALRYPMGVYYAFKPAASVWSPPIHVVDRQDFWGGHVYQATLSGGNQLHAVWQKGSEEGDVVYMRITTSAPTLPFPVVPTTSPQTTPGRQVPTSVATSESGNLDYTPVSPVPGHDESITRTASAMEALLWGILPATVLIALVVGLRLKR